ncbi:hypothetical protein [Avibacterium sp. 21-599]|uniref:hypothetical protein n=1 Tax=Avibacterium sp. 21-599 TaxID=2911528 RepID=UPI002246146B|nr:hypothetical protein [Avibacterium sp. 21-599]MCW9718682.1 hypothetical protein [Avibacterium sp. 21-599]
MPTPIITKTKTQPIENNSYTIHAEDAYFLVLGFEVNKSPLTNPNFEEEMKQNQEEDNKPQQSAYQRISIEDDEGHFETDMPVHQVLSDPGHAFMYLVKNLNATIFLSVGPLANDAERLAEYRKTYQLPDQEQINQMLAPYPAAQVGYGLGQDFNRAYGIATADYRISEKVTLFQLKITEAQYEAIYKNVVRIRNGIEQREQYYNIANNYTCAKVVRDDAIGNILPDLPWGRSAVMTGHIQAINPYAFYDQMQEYEAQNELVGRKVIDKGKENITKRFWDEFITAIRDNEQPYDVFWELEKTR